MPKRRRVSRPHVESKPPQRLVTKARKQEWEEEERRQSAPAATVAPAKASVRAVVLPPRSKAADRFPESPDLLVLLTGRKKSGV